MTCPVCNNSSSSKPFFQQDGYDILICGECDHGYLDYVPSQDHVETIYGDEYFEGGKDGYPNYVSQAELLIQRGEHYASLMSRFRPPGLILDVGCGAGFLLKGFVHHGWGGEGIEPNAKMADYGRTELGLNVSSHALEEFETDAKFDLVNMIQVVSHLHDVNTAMLNAARLLTPGGFLLVETWDRKSRMARLMGRNWHEYSPPTVLHWFTRGSLKKLGEKVGLTCRDSGKAFRKINVAHARSLLRHKSSSSAIYRFMEKVTAVLPGQINVPYPSDDLFWMLFETPS